MEEPLDNDEEGYEETLAEDEAADADRTDDSLSRRHHFGTLGMLPENEQFQFPPSPPEDRAVSGPRSSDIEGSDAVIQEERTIGKSGTGTSKDSGVTEEVSSQEDYEDDDFVEVEDEDSDHSFEEAVTEAEALHQKGAERPDRPISARGSRTRSSSGSIGAGHI
mmetsp:Transcript_30485/g.47751  ORF Transcript_30485/g.47751 Transcript_30485/m.47751 type:complete len:164 (+) Transcript_30485:1415-1906(+)